MRLRSQNIKLGMDWYNKFIEKATGLEIKNLDEFYSQIISSSSLNENKQLDILAYTFEDENDAFTRLRYIATIYSSPNEQILVKKNLFSRFKESSDFLIPIVTTIITIITTFFLKPPT